MAFGQTERLAQTSDVPTRMLARIYNAPGIYGLFLTRSFQVWLESSRKPGARRGNLMMLNDALC